MKYGLMKWLAAIICCCFVFLSCQDDEDTTTNVNGVEYDPSPYSITYGAFDPPNIASDNQLTIQGVKLGRMLFYEKRLSKNNSLSCAGCHRQKHAFTDTSRFSIGIRGKFGKRQAMSVFNMAWNENEFFWDGRAHLLRHQALMPIQDSLEMDEQLENIVQKLNVDQNYLDQFMSAFGSEEITELKISLALEQFMNSIVSVESKYDRYLRGEIVLDTNEERGRYLFFAEFNPGIPNLSGADCAHCHIGKNFENDKYLNNALDTDAGMMDNGRMNVTGMSSDKGKFKVTSLRNIELTAPYMHDGRFQTLEEVVDHYNSGMKMSSTIDPALIYPLNSGGLQLTNEDKRDLIAFLKTLTDEVMLTNQEYSNPFEN